jgi:hypothetical protein
MHKLLVYGFVILSQLALAVFKVLEIKWVVENNITKSVILFNIQTCFIYKFVYFSSRSQNTFEL